jgi:hypothetical protein
MGTSVSARSLLFPLVVRVTSCEPFTDRASGKPSGLFNIKVWLDELVSDGSETVTNKQVQTFTSPVELQKGGDYLLTVELDCDATPRVTKDGKPYLMNKTVRIKRVHSAKKLTQPSSVKGG